MSSLDESGFGLIISTYDVRLESVCGELESLPDGLCQPLHKAECGRPPTIEMLCENSVLHSMDNV